MTHQVISAAKGDDCKMMAMDDWLSTHNIKHLKKIFVDHNMDKLTDLSLQNPNFASLITDKRLFEFANQNIMFRIVAAIQALDKELECERQKQLESETETFIIPTPKEDQTMKDIQQYANYMKKLRDGLKEIESRYEVKVASNNDIIKTNQRKCLNDLNKMDVSVYINELRHVIKQKSCDLKKQIEAYHKELDDEKSQSLNEINKMESVLCDQCIVINEGIKHFKSKIIECKNIMKEYSKHNDKFDEYHTLIIDIQREKRIVEIAQNAKTDFIDKVKRINSFDKQINKFIVTSNHNDSDEKKESDDDDVRHVPFAMNPSINKDIENDIDSFITITEQNHSEDGNNELENENKTKPELPCFPLRFPLSFKKKTRVTDKLQSEISKLKKSIKANKTSIGWLQQQKHWYLLHAKIKNYRNQKCNDEGKKVDSHTNYNTNALSLTPSTTQQFENNVIAFNQQKGSDKKLLEKSILILPLPANSSNDKLLEEYDSSNILNNNGWKIMF